MKKRRILNSRLPGADNITGVVPPSLGGTGDNSEATVVDHNLWVTKDRIRKPYGIIPLVNGKVLMSDIENADRLLEYVTIVGPTEIMVNSINSYQITNHDANTTYTLSVNAGSVGMDTINTFSIVAPSTPTDLVLNINGFEYNISCVVNSPKAPVINTPANLSTNIGKVVQVAINPVELNKPGILNHDSTDWQISGDIAFTSMIVESIGDTTNKTSWSGVLVNTNTNYYIRARVHDAILGYSSWSSVVAIRTKSNFNVSIETARFYNNDNTTSHLFANSSLVSLIAAANMSISGDGTIVAAGAPGVPSYMGTTKGVIYIKRKISGSWTEVKKITDPAPGSVMSLSIPSGGSITVTINGTNPSTNTYTSSQNINIPSGTSYVSLSGKGQDGSYSSGGSYLYWNQVVTSNSTPTIDPGSYNNSPPSTPPSYVGQSGGSWRSSSGPWNPGANWEYYQVSEGVWTAAAINVPPSTITGTSSTATINGTTYTFPGGVGVAATVTNATATLNPYSIIGNAVAISNDGLRLAYIRENSTDGTTFTYDLVFMRNTGNDTWSVENTITNINLSTLKAYQLTFEFSKDGNSFFVSTPGNNTILTYRYNSGWVASTSIVISGNTDFLTTLASLNHIAISQDGLKVALIARTKNSGGTATGYPYFLHYTRASLTGNWNLSYSYRFTADISDSQYLDQAIWGNDDLSVLAVRNLQSPATAVGQVIVYKFDGVNLTKSCVISNPQTAQYDRFGFAVDVSGDGKSIAIALVSKDASGNQTKKGRVFVYDYNAATNVATLESTLTGHDTLIGDQFGTNIALSNDATALAVSGYIGNSYSNRGAVYIFN